MLLPTGLCNDIKNVPAQSHVTGVSLSLTFIKTESKPEAD